MLRGIDKNTFHPRRWICEWQKRAQYQKYRWRGMMKALERGMKRGQWYRTRKCRIV